MNLYTCLKSDPNIWGQSLSRDFWYGEPRTQTDLVFQCPDGFVRSHKFMLRTCSRTIASALEGKVLNLNLRFLYLKRPNLGEFI